jgi:hypothetical protein
MKTGSRIKTDVSNIKTPLGSLPIPLTKGKYALVDFEDFQRVNQYDWFLNSKGYAYRLVNKKAELMHRFIMDVSDPKIMIDHKYHNILDNRKAFLRTCNKSQNGMNRKANKISSSSFKGVYFHKLSNKWNAQIMLNGKNQSLGLFLKEEEAAKAYDAKATEIFGEFALLNFKSHE